MEKKGKHLKQAFATQNTGLNTGYAAAASALSANALPTITKFTHTITASTSNPDSDLPLVDTDTSREVPASKSNRGSGEKALDHEFGNLGSFRSCGPL